MPRGGRPEDVRTRKWSRVASRANQGPERHRRPLEKPAARLVAEAREGHVDVIAKIGGHFGATMGVADLTVALHYAFDTPRLT